MDKHKIVKRILLIGILINIYFIYQNTSKFVQL